MRLRKRYSHNKTGQEITIIFNMIKLKTEQNLFPDLIGTEIWDSIVHIQNFSKSNKKHIRTYICLGQLAMIEQNFIIDGNAGWYSHFEGSLAVSCQLNIVFPYDQSSWFLCYLPNAVKTYIPTKLACEYLEHILVHTCQNMEATQRCFIR